MKKLLLFIYVFVISLVLTGIIQAQDTENNSPLRLSSAYTGDLVNNYPGGIRNGSRYLGMANFSISFNTQDAGLWNGGSFFISAINTHGGTPTGEFIGDYQGVSNIEAGNLTYLQELWIGQTIGSFSVFAGLQDLAANFAVSEYGALFLNGSFGTISTLSHNIPAPVFPMTTPGVQVHWNDGGNVTAQVAFFDGLPEDPSVNPYNLSWKLDGQSGIITAAEIGVSTRILSGLGGTYKIGAYYHEHSSCIDKICGVSYDENYGAYIIADQILMGEPEGKMLALFTQAGFSPATKNENHLYLGAGINYSGILKEEGSDVLGFGIAHASFTNGRPAETTLELSYKYTLQENIYVQPDIQYIINPAGGESRLKNTTAGILRFGFSI